MGRPKRVIDGVPSTKPEAIVQQNRNIQKTTVKAMVDRKHSSVQFQDLPSTLSDNVNYKSVLINGQQQDLFICTICSELEFIDTIDSHQLTCRTPVKESDVADTMSTPAADKAVNEAPSKKIMKSHSRDIPTMIREQLTFSFAEMFPLEAFNDKGFLSMTKYLLNVGASYGKLNATELLGNSIALVEERKSLVLMVKSALKKVVAEEKLVFSCDLWKHPLHSKRCVTLSSHYIDNEFTLHRNVLGTQIYNEMEFDGGNLANYVTSILSEYTSTPSSILSNATIVTSPTEDFLKSFKNYGRLNCMCTILNEVVNHSLALPCFQTEDVCKAIRIRFERQPPNEKYKNVIANLQLNDWCSIWHLFEAYEEYLWSSTVCKNIIPGYEILHKFLMESRNASRLLSSNTEATVCTVYLIKKKLIDVMRTYNSGLFRMPEYKDKLTSYAENIFEITDVHRITLFLDPRYKSLKFLSKDERDVLHATVRGIIGEIFIPDENVKSVLKLGEHVAWVDANGMAEVDNYLNLTNISPDTNVLEFWKERSDFPKLRTLAKEMLCIPAVSATWECYFNKDKFNLSRRRLHLNLNELDSTLLLNGFDYCGMFNEELKTLFEM